MNMFNNDKGNNFNLYLYLQIFIKLNIYIYIKKAIYEVTYLCTFTHGLLYHSVFFLDDG